MKSLPAFLVGALCAGLLSWGRQGACDAGTANFPRAEQGTPRYDYCHSLPTGHPWLLALLVSLSILVGIAVALRRNERASALAVGVLLVALLVHLAVVASLSGNLTI
jgi:hypothetical protein